MVIMEGPPNDLEHWEIIRSENVAPNRGRQSAPVVTWAPQGSQAQSGPSQAQAGLVQHNPFASEMASPGPCSGMPTQYVHPMSLPPMTWQDRVGNLGYENMSGGGVQQYTQAGDPFPQGANQGSNQGQGPNLSQGATQSMWVSQGESGSQAFQGVSFNTQGQPIRIEDGWGPQYQIRAINTPQVLSVGLLFSPLMQMLTNNLKPPILEKDHFMDFKLKFPTFLDQASAGQTGLTDDMKLGVLKMCIPDAAKTELQRREEEHIRGSGPPPKYNDFWNWLCRIYGSGKDDQTVIKEELRTLKPENSGKLTFESWNAYMAQFKLLQCRLEDPNEKSLSNGYRVRSPII